MCYLTMNYSIAPCDIPGTRYVASAGLFRLVGDLPVSVLLIFIIGITINSAGDQFTRLSGADRWDVGQ